MTKGAKPVVLQANEAAWTAAVVAAHAQGVTSGPMWNHYRHPEIKQAVQDESQEKCIYCESKVRHVSFGDIEHYRPKSSYPTLTYLWGNLGFVCSICNNKKRDVFDEDLPFVNPFEDDPAGFFFARGAALYPVHGNGRAALTHAQLGLNRPDLLEKRGHAIDSLNRLVEQIRTTENQALRAALTAQLHALCAPGSEFSFVGSQFVTSLGL